MLTIDHMALRLPPSLRDRANGIAHLIGETLADLPHTQSLRIRRLAVPQVEVDPAASDADIAGTIAAAIHKEIIGHGHTFEGR